MPLPTAILFIAALTAAALAAVGWWMDPAAPALGPWFIGRLSEGGLWTGLVLFLLVAAYFVWRGNHPGRGTPR
ncbi:hypothetical protein Q8W71_32700 [Methylobacterium sp. NEAU 140]|uniref:hypothetical protein n=1 Tax=Methylobacterium sp. NEAU 140 TaxID=3064945 RepID=UPI002734D946|nr:hypothetical protein [Methylobacterium sp. NEAU 140]MDP4027322.1 hypothetical protein [Methylobacterium sp. NEAU 140]